MSDTNAALIAFVGVLAGGYLNNFLAEDFRRFRDGQALAGALAGELKSHATAIPILQSTLQSTADAIRKPDVGGFVKPTLHGGTRSSKLLNNERQPVPAAGKSRLRLVL
ncbi:hypothetical protein AB4Y38_40755 [Paraburkholderia sp. EG285A]|uniref:hypothetical protein n=1 Tax=Paraburkholderia sp. EG285A TaxID=3237009 RepID=UPI0034D2E549